MQNNDGFDMQKSLDGRMAAETLGNDRDAEEVFYVIYQVGGEFDCAAVSKGRVNLVSVAADPVSAYQMAEELEDRSGGEMMYWYCVEQSHFEGLKLDADFDEESLKLFVDTNRIKLLGFVEENIRDRLAFDAFGANYGRFSFGLNVSLLLSVLLVVASIGLAFTGRFLLALYAFVAALLVPAGYVLVARKIFRFDKE